MTEPYSFYDATVVMAKGALGSLDRILTAAQGHPDSQRFTTSRLAEDMRPLSFQVHYTAFSAHVVVALLSGTTYEQDGPHEISHHMLDSYEKMHARIAQAVAALEGIDRAAVNQMAETVTVTMTPDGSENEVPLKTLISVTHMPNIYFHCSIASAILRVEGVPLGKRDWLRPFIAAHDY